MAIVKSLICSAGYWSALTAPEQAVYTNTYATLAEWMTACPDLTATSTLWEGHVSEEPISLAGNAVTIGGKNPSATAYVYLRSRPGKGFWDRAGVRTNPLRFDASKGASITCTGIYAYAIYVTQPYTRFYGLQIAQTDGTTNAQSAVYSAQQYTTFDSCIIEGNTPTAGVLELATGNCSVTRSLVINRKSGAAKIAVLNSGSSAYSTVFACTGASPAAVGVDGLYGAPTLRNVHVGHATAPVFTGANAPTWAVTTSTADAAASGFTAAPFTTATFTSVATDGTHDFRTVAGSALINAGTVDATYAPTDVTGQAWVGGTDIGLWDFSAAGGTHLVTVANSSQANVASSVAISQAVVAGTITLPACRQWETGNLRLNESGVTVIVNNLTTGALVVKKTGLTTHATTGICVVNDAAIVAGTPYRVTQILADGNEGTWKYTAS